MYALKMLAVCLVLLVAGPRALASNFRVENKCAPATKFTVTNKCAPAAPAKPCCGECTPEKNCREVGCPANGGARCSCSDTKPLPGFRWQRIGNGPWELVPDTTPAPSFAIPSAGAPPTGGCVGGNCPVPTQSYQRGGFFRR